MGHTAQAQYNRAQQNAIYNKLKSNERPWSVKNSFCDNYISLVKSEDM